MTAGGLILKKHMVRLRKDYIERVPHVVPLSSIDEEVTVNPRTDLIVLCSNCHRMVHRRKNQVLTLDELIKIINKGQE